MPQKTLKVALVLVVAALIYLGWKVWPPADTWHSWAEPVKNWFEAFSLFCALLYFFIKIFLQKTFQRLSLDVNVVVLPVENKGAKKIIAVECNVVNKGAVRLDITSATYEIKYDGNPLKGEFQPNISRRGLWWRIVTHPKWSVDASSTVRLHDMLDKKIDADYITVEAKIAVNWSADTYIAKKVIRLTKFGKSIKAAISDVERGTDKALETEKAVENINKALEPPNPALFLLAVGAGLAVEMLRKALAPPNQGGGQSDNS